MPLRILFWSGLAGTVSIVLSVTCAALVYRGRKSERYSLLNHFISELGEVGISRGAWAFNGGMVLTGILLLPFAVCLGPVLGGVLGWVGASLAVVAALGAAAVGVFPMNTLRRHVPAAMVFFYGGLGLAVVVGVAILVQPPGRVVIPKLASVLSLATALAFGAFLVLPPIVIPGFDPINQLNPLVKADRPRFWILPFMEWQVFIWTVAWVFGMAVVVGGP